MRQTELLFPENTTGEPPKQPHSFLRSNASETSVEAAHRVQPRVTSQVARVYRYIATQGERGATDKEIEAALNMGGSSARPRRVWLRDEGFVEATERKRHRSTVWIITGKPLQLQRDGESA